VLLYAIAGAALAPLFSLVWRRLPIHRSGGLRLEGAVFALLFGSALLAVDINRFMPAGALEAKSLIADGIVAACGVIILAVLLLFSRGTRFERTIRPPRRRVPLAGALCAGLVLAGTGANAWMESGKGSPIARTATMKAAPTWEFPLPGGDGAVEPGDANELPAAHPTRPKLVVIGLDGATWSLMQPLMERGRLPNLTSLLARGVGGVLRSTEDSFSPIVWTTLFTGKVPAKHGIDRMRNTLSVNRRVHALWDVLSEHEQTLLVANVPGTFPAEAIRGTMLAGFPNESETGNNLGYVYTTRPTSQWDRLSGLRIESLGLAATHDDGSVALRVTETSHLPRQSALIWAIEAATGSGASPLEGWLLRTYATFEVHRSAGGLRFELPGCEGCGFALETGWSPWILIERPRRPLAFRLRVMEATPEATSVYVTPLFLLDWETQAFPAEVAERLEWTEGPYLAEASGWLDFRDPRLLDTLAEHLFGAARDREREVSRLWRSADWDDLVYVFTLIDRVQHSFWSFLDLREFPRISPPDPYPNPFPEGIHREDYARVIPQAYEWVDREIGRLIAGLPSSTLIVVVSDHGFRSGRSRIPGSGIHDPDGVYIFSGAGLLDSRPRGGTPWAKGPVLNLVDLLPTLLPLIGVPVASDFDGVPAPFVEETLRRRGERIARIPSFESRAEWQRRKDTELDRGALQQLRSLGYVE
jgi:predicted AlkP superfamily phosphohydrolase/phosphomutase